jgi:aminopeptidase N
VWAGRSYNIALGDLSAERWSLLPMFGDALADIETSRRGWLSYARSGGQQEDVSLFNRIEKKNISIYASPAKLATRGRFYSEDTDRVYDIEHYDISTRFTNLERHTMSGTATIRLKLLKHDVGTITIKLADSLAVSSVTSTNFGRLLQLRIVGQDSVLISLPELQPAGTVITLTIAYAGRLAPQSLAREAAAVEGVVVQEPQENVVQAEPNYAYTVNSYWYPQSQVTDYATATLAITVPQEYQAFASGKFVGESLNGTDRLSTFLAEVPARYLSAVISKMAPLPRTTITVSDGATVTIDARANPRQVGNTRTLTQRAAEMMKFYASLAGGVPYPSFTLLALESDLPGGHSPPYFAALNQPTPSTIFSWRNDPIAFDDQFPDFFMAHEIAHQWWGHAIGAKNYHEQWLSEGLAQYFAYLYAGKDRGPNVQRGIFERMRQSVRRFDDSGPISLGYRLGHVVGDGTNYRAIVYNKSVVVLEMLRQLIGDEAFSAGLQRFYRENRNGKAGTDDLRAAFEAEAREPLGRFFDRWVLDSGFPELKLTSVIETGGRAAQVRIEQTGQIFDAPVTIAIFYEDKATEYVTVKVRGALTEQRIPLNGRLRKDGIRLQPVV